MLKHYSFSPLIAAMAGNVGVQSSIIVQGLANNTLRVLNRLVKEVSLSLLNGVILAVILFVGSHSRRQNGHWSNSYHRISFGNYNCVAYRNVCTLVIINLESILH
jgi:Mg/Co/Ni transporter MgtE